MPEITTFYLEMTSRARFQASQGKADLNIVETEIKQYRFNRFLYQLIGEQWKWQDKLAHSDEQWKAFVENEHLRTWVAYHKGAIAGYYELHRQAHGNTELAYFGLAPGFIGRGFGAHLLSHAIFSAWDWEGTERLWVHTCTTDHPNAISNYTARGFEIYHEETREK